jgi:hypothetical protein
VKVTKVPGICLFPIIIAVCLVGAYATNVSSFYVWEIAGIAVIGLVLRRLGYSLPSLIMGLVLGSTLESNIYLTHTLYPGLSFLWQRPDADVIFLLALTVLVLHLFRRRRTRHSSEQLPYPLLNVIVSTALGGISVAAVAYSLTHFGIGTGILPECAGTMAGAGALLQLPRQMQTYLHRNRISDLPNGGKRQSEKTPQQTLHATQDIGLELPGRQSGPVTVPSDPLGVGNWRSNARSDRVNRIVDRSWGTNGQYTREVVAFCWIVVAILLSLLFGYVVGIPSFTGLYGLFATRRVFNTWKWRIVFAVATASTLYLIIFELFSVLNVLEPKGIL